MAYKWSKPTSYGLDGRKAGKCVSILNTAPQSVIEEKAREATRIALAKGQTR